ncbi:MAG: ATP-dependent Clp protease ATP-binding subunit [Candidatus Doudnabacteria bacterium]|nr:ATP-dependent Clp protease ATP-binding subunit [Candidatus Doudnabacteria bacterium]
MSINISKNKTPWGTPNDFEGINLNFSAAYNLSSINNFYQALKIEQYSRFTLWSLVFIGITALLFQLILSFYNQDWSFFFVPQLLNIPTALALFSSLYLWAKQKEQQAKDHSLNLLYLNPVWQIENSRKNTATVDIFEIFNLQAKLAWQKASELSLQENLSVPSLNHILSCLLESLDLKEACLRLGINSKDLIKFINKNPTISSRTPELPFISFEIALKLHNKSIDPLMLFCACVKILEENSALSKLFTKLEISQEKWEAVSAWIFTLRILQDDIRLFKKLSKLKPTGDMNVGLTAVPTPFLDRFSTDLTWQARLGRLPISVGRHEDLEELFQLFAQNNKYILIKGEEGTGRSALVNELAFKMETEQVPASLQDKRLVRLEISGILGNPQKSEVILEELLNEAAKSGNIVLVVEDIEQMSKARTISGLSLLELFTDSLQSLSLQAIVTCDPEAYVDFLQKTPNFTQIFTEHELKTLTPDQILLAACVKASLIESHHNCIFLFQAIEKSIALSNELLRGVGQPQKAVQLLTETASKSKSKNKEPILITAEEIEKIISDKTHIPQNTINGDEAQKLLTLEVVLSQSIIGQTQAIKAVCESLKRARSGLASDTRPLASFLFLGPTGVGKTEVAKTLAREYFGKEEFLLRLDMSEFAGGDAMYKLLGAKGEEFDPPLIKHLKNYPYCLLLLDEFEKARTEIHNLFLQILDDGRLTTAKGELISLSHCLIIATSNAGTKNIQDGFKSGKNLEEIKTELFQNALLKTFAPELLNRFDSTVVFSPLSPQDTKAIARLQLKDLQKKLDAKGIKITFTENVIEDIAKNAFDPLLGGRPVRRYIQDHVENFIADLLLNKKLNKGHKGSIDITEDGFKLKSQP